jgi:hypothetical protein
MTLLLHLQNKNVCVLLALLIFALVLGVTIKQQTLLHTHITHAHACAHKQVRVCQKITQ